MIYILTAIILTVALIAAVDLIVKIREKLEQPKAAVIKIHNRPGKDNAA